MRIVRSIPSPLFTVAVLAISTGSFPEMVSFPGRNSSSHVNGLTA
jgi:hypothetical protein